jgi:hypothetical protein
MRAPFVSNVRGWLASIAVAASTLCGSAAQAAVYVTDWDPVFNPTFSGVPGNINLGWAGSATVTVDDGCLVPSTLPVPGVGACASASLDSYSVVFYNASIGPAAVVAGVAGISPLPALSQLSVDANANIDGIDMLGTLNLGIFGFSGSNFYTVELDFTLTGPTLRMVGVDGIDLGVEYLSTVPPVVTWTRVPEPAPLLLVAAALALMGAQSARRERRQLPRG